MNMVHILLPYELSPWSTVLEKLLTALLLNSLPFMESEGLLPCSLESATGSYTESDESISHLSTYFSQIHSNIFLLSAPRSASHPNCPVNGLHMENLQNASGRNIRDMRMVSYVAYMQLI
jgi:hypothetical protein